MADKGADKGPEKEPQNQQHFLAPAVPDIQPVVPSIQPVTQGGTVFERFKLEEPVNEPNREPAGALVSPTGLTRSNTGGHLLFTKLAQNAGQDPDNFALEYGVSKENKQISFYAVSRLSPGAAPIRRDPARQQTTVYLKPIFKKHSTLRPAVRQECSLYLSVDAHGDECLVLPLNTGLDKPVTSRKSGKKDA